MLNLNQPISNPTGQETDWKVLVYDRFGQDIISPLVSIKDLRELGVTLHVLVSTYLSLSETCLKIYSVIPYANQRTYYVKTAHTNHKTIRCSITYIRAPYMNYITRKLSTKSHKLITDFYDVQYSY